MIQKATDESVCHEKKIQYIMFSKKKQLSIKVSQKFYGIRVDILTDGNWQMEIRRSQLWLAIDN